MFRVIGATRDELRGFMASLGDPAYRADQVLQWVYRQGAQSFGGMANLPKATRAALAERATLLTSSVRTVQTSRDGTAKLLVELADGEAVETVIIPAGDRRTVCISTQVGCAVGCAFCASGLGGLVRDLTAGEIVEEVVHARALIVPAGAAANIVVMGIGEPLGNYEALVRALEVFAAEWGMGISGRRITVSTVGLPGRIRALAAEGLGVNLAVSLHASDDVTRRRLIPGAKPVREVVAAARDYLDATGREVTFEVVLVKDVNDSADDARGLAELVGKLPTLVNLIPLNPVVGLPWQEPPPARVEQFAATLRRRGVRAEVRRRRGGDIDAACGQLRRRGTAGQADRGEPSLRQNSGH